MRNLGSIQKTPRGFALVAALFMIVVLAGLAMFALRLSGSRQQATNLTVLNARAVAMANTGIEYGANQALQHAACPPPTLKTWTLNQPELNGFTINISCMPSTHLISPICPPSTCFVYELQSTATYGAFGQPDFVSRTAWRTVSNIP